MNASREKTGDAGRRVIQMFKYLDSGKPSRAGVLYVKKGDRRPLSGMRPSA